MALLNSVIFLTVIVTVMSSSFIPSSVYVIDSSGRIRRDIKFEPLLRVRRNGGSSATAYSSASASASSSSGGGGAPINFGGYTPNFAGEGFGNLGDGFPQNLPAGAQIFSRFGEEEGSGVLASGAAQGPKGAFSSTSVTADDSGKVKYSVKSAKY